MFDAKHVPGGNGAPQRVRGFRYWRPGRDRTRQARSIVRFNPRNRGDIAAAAFRISFFGRLAEIVNEYLKKGSSVYIEGRIRTRKWQAQDGTDRYSTEIVAEQMQMLGGRNGSGDRQHDDNAGEFDQQDRSRLNRQPPAARAAAGRPAAPPSQPAQSFAGGGAPRGGGFDEYDDQIPF